MQSVRQWLTNAGVSVPSQWQLTDATGTNQDGSVLVGNGKNAANTSPAGTYEAWLARVSPQGSGLMDIAEYQQTLAQTGAMGIRVGNNLADLALFGAHHRSLYESGFPSGRNGIGVWATGDAAHYHDSNSNAQLAEVGVRKEIGSAIVGLGVGKAWARQDLALGGDARYRGNYLLAEWDQAFGKGIHASLLGYYGRYHTDIARHYLNGAAISSSSGSPDAHSVALHGRLAWHDLVRVQSVGLSPFVGYAWIRSHLDAYTEQGGAFPAHFDSQSWHTNDARVGLSANTELGMDTHLRASAEAVHRFEGNTGATTGQIVGLSAFALPGQAVHQNWVRGTVDIDHQLTRHNTITVGANVGNPGGDPSWGVTAGWRARF